MHPRSLSSRWSSSRWRSRCRTWISSLAAALLMAGAPQAAFAVYCGDAILDGGEVCDDGNNTGGDGCSATCGLEACGNNILEGTEICDPGTGVRNTINGYPGPNACDAPNAAWCIYAIDSTPICDFDCTTPTCGDGYLNPFAGELCDPTAAGWSPATCDGPTGFGACTPAAWGDGTVNAAAGELCDDGNLVDGDGCDHNSRPTGCGSYVVTGTEQCDDGGTASPNGDGCDQNCKSTACGNSIVTAGEACDDGNLINGDGCDVGCQFETCQNGLLQAGEQCDDANNVNGDGCDVNCKIELCGNGIFQPGSAPPEQCDDGNLANGDGCDAGCHLEQCGNGYVQTGEACDPATGTTGNPLLAVSNTASCDRDCTVPFCQDGIVNTFVPEQCDDGNGFCGDGCRANCTSEICGDGLVDCGEGCDDGNVVSGDGCDSQCDTEVCGNGVVQPALGENCDDGNLVSGDGCDSNCRVTGCGNGVTAGTESCDDGNLISGDGCDANCTLTACGNGVQTSGEECDDGNLASLDGCSSGCGDEVCGNGIVGTLTKVPPEVCDDGNPIQTDGCVALGPLPYPGAGCFSEPDGDATKAGPYMLDAYDIGGDGCEAATYGAATPPNQKAAKPVIRIARFSTPGMQSITMTGYFNPARNKVCEDGLTSCTTSAQCSFVPGADSCGIPRPNLQGVHLELRNLLSPTTATWLPLFAIDIPGEIGVPGGEYQQKSATPACGNPRDGWKVQSVGTRTTYTYVNASGLIPSVGGIDGVCSASAQGVKTIKLIYDAVKNQWSYNVAIRATTLANFPTVSGGKVKGTLQAQIALGTRKPLVADDPGDVGNCADAQFRGAGSGGTGDAAGCKIGGTTITCK